MSNYVIAFNKKAQEDIDIIAEYVFRFTFNYDISEKLVRDMYSRFTHYNYSHTDSKNIKMTLEG